MKTEKADNQLFFKNMSFIKKSVTTIFCAFFAISSYANHENHENVAPANQVDNHSDATTEEHGASTGSEHADNAHKENHE